MLHVGLVLRARRREMNMSQASLAEKMQTSQEVISNYENGVTPVRADDLPRFAGILAVTPIYFFEPNQQNKAASAQYQPVDAHYQRGGVGSDQRDGIHPAAGGVSAVAEIDSRAAEESADHALSSEHAPKQAAAKVDAAEAARPDGKKKPEALDRGPDALKSDATTSDAAKYDAEKCNALPLRALSEADLEKVMLTCYRALGSRMRILAVKLIREIAQDEREPAARVVVWKAKP